VTVQLVKTPGKPIWEDRYSQVYPGGDPLIGDVIGEHLARLLEQGERRTSPSGKVFDAVGDFSLKPQGQSSWRYGHVMGWSGIGFRQSTERSESCGGAPGEICWLDGPPPDHVDIGRNTTSRPLEFYTMIDPPDALWMSTGSRFTTLRWIAPADGHYSVQGRIRIDDTVGRPTRIKLVHNTVHVLLERRNFAGFDSRIPIDVPDLPLTQGSALDLILGPEIAVDFLSIDVQLRIQPIAKS
jgi:hypothetical protein